MYRKQTWASHWFSLASPSRRCLENTPDSDPQLALIHPKHAMPFRSPISITWKLVEGGARILARVVVTSRYVCPGVPRRSRSYLNRFSSHTVINVQVPCLSLRSLKLGNPYSCSHARVSKRPPADLAIIEVRLHCFLFYFYSLFLLLQVLHYHCIAHL